MAQRILYTQQSPAARKFATIIKIAGLNVSIDNIEFGVDNETEAWLKNCHPCQRAPVMDTGADGYIFESHAIFRHLLRLAEKNGKTLYGKNPVEASQVDMWIDFTANELNAVFAPILYTLMGYMNASAEVQAEKFAALQCNLSGLDTWLETRTFLVGERLSGADIAVACSVEVVLSMLPQSYELWKYKNVVRHYMTTFYAHAGFAEGQKMCGGTGFPVAKPEAPKKEAPKKEAPKKKEAAPAPADDADEEPVVEAPKKKNPLDDLPPSKFVLDAWKREYSNNKDTRGGAMKWLFENFDKDGWTMWYSKYKYNEELSQTFMTSNLVRGWFQRMEGVRKYAFGIALILGTSASHEIHTFWIFRGQGPELPECVKDVEDVSLHTWRQIKPEEFEKEKELIGDFLCWDGTALPKPCLEGRCFK